jgi:hypothetical protein
MDTCKVCGENGKMEKHHLCYKENKIIRVCHSCHQKIHHTHQYLDLIPIDHCKFTLIPIQKKTVKKLKNYYEHGDDTYDIVLNRLMDFWDKHNKK